MGVAARWILLGMTLLAAARKGWVQCGMQGSGVPVFGQLPVSAKIRSDLRKTDGRSRPFASRPRRTLLFSWYRQAPTRPAVRFSPSKKWSCGAGHGHVAWLFMHRHEWVAVPRAAAGRNSSRSCMRAHGLSFEFELGGGASREGRAPRRRDCRGQKLLRRAQMPKAALHVNLRARQSELQSPGLRADSIRRLTPASKRKLKPVPRILACPCTWIRPAHMQFTSRSSHATWTRTELAPRRTLAPVSSRFQIVDGAGCLVRDAMTNTLLDLVLRLRRFESFLATVFCGLVLRICSRSHWD